MQAKDDKIIAVTDKVKAFFENLGLWVRKLEAKMFGIFSCLNSFVEKISVKKVTLEFIGVSKITWLICSPSNLSTFQK
jgi:hypothetical protein